MMSGWFPSETECRARSNQVRVRRIKPKVTEPERAEALPGDDTDAMKSFNWNRAQYKKQTEVSFPRQPNYKGIGYGGKVTVLVKNGKPARGVDVKYLEAKHPIKSEFPKMLAEMRARSLKPSWREFRLRAAIARMKGNTSEANSRRS